MIVSGRTTSRLSELEKFVVSSDVNEKYFLSGDINTNGVDVNKSSLNTVPRIIVYYVDGIEYRDFIDGNVNTTNFIFEGQGYNSPDFINHPTYKDPNKENIFMNPKIENDVFIDREEESAFKDNQILEYVGNLVELTTYAGGNYFNIVNNN